VKNINQQLYTTDLLNDWGTRESIIPAESYLIDKYLTHKTGKVIEAGTGGGRLAFYIEKTGFRSIEAFDYVPGMIVHANERKSKINSTVEFKVADATNLALYANNSFDYLIYLQQVLCFIEDEQLFLKALSESYRIAKDGGIVIFSFLDYHSRAINIPLQLILIILRKLRGEKISKHYLPWLKINNSFNRKLLSKNQAQTYWVKKDEIIDQLQQFGFKILEAKNASQINSNTTKRSGMLYVVCVK
jgi:ubiquinone/menaquinone biosynthesis C-methylase UbiE